MLPGSGSELRAMDRRAVTLFGMSGVGKTRVAGILRSAGWFHYSVDYRIGTRYMGEAINDNLKREAMCSPLLRDLLMTGSATVKSNIGFHDLSPLSTYLGKPGDPARGGVPFREYARRQAQHREAEIAAMGDVPAFIERAERVYGYAHVVCDTSGSLCEVVDPNDPDDPVLTALAAQTIIVYIRGSEAHEASLVQRFMSAPKPMYYAPDFLDETWSAYLVEHGITHERDVDPDDFITQGFRRLLRRRIPRYQAIADGWGYAVEAEDIACIRGEGDFLDLLADAIDRRAALAPAATAS